MSSFPFPTATPARSAPTARWLAYTPYNATRRTWKRYRGGLASNIWLFNLEDNTSRQITDWEGTDTLPMWAPGNSNDKVYFLSDAGEEARLNIWMYDLRNNRGRRSRASANGM
jgi:tricorn protease